MACVISYDCRNQLSKDLERREVQGVEEPGLRGTDMVVNPSPGLNLEEPFHERPVRAAVDRREDRLWFRK